MTESVRTQIFRAVGMFLGVVMILFGSVDILLSIMGEMRPFDSTMGVSPIFMGWLFVSYGLGWSSPFRKEAPSPADK
ncbi:hypothetical protein ELE36_06840 [Pseudolysobacter antarcticus]|uniref:Uncharacterized protein n=1 Tax=Pseudolysobacter antarcticus TaxID=2511995 RepID=A0A411HI64_9GAMM|nr:hypothetical protein [Pseudolysobacter antarcticus]QBB70104.1 hypothetical protein ELE36_06840 [Pseudolysobacter antarcticus]